MKTILMTSLIAMALLGTVMTAQAEKKCDSCCTCKVCTCTSCACCACTICKCAE